MKKLKALLFISLLFGTVGMVRAADEVPQASGFGLTHIGVVYTTSGTARAGEVRNMTTNDNGDQLVLDGRTDLVITSTGGPLGTVGGGRAEGLTGSAITLTVGNSTNSFTVTASSFAGQVGCRNFGDNCNVVKLATLARPVFVKRLMVGDVVGNGTLTPGRARIRIFDTQGTTGTNNTPLSMIYNQTVTSGTIQDIGVWCSSGVMVLKDSPVDFQLILGQQNR